MSDKAFIVYFCGLIALLAIQAALITVALLNFPQLSKGIFGILVFVSVPTVLVYDHAIRKGINRLML